MEYFRGEFKNDFDTAWEACVVNEGFNRTMLRRLEDLLSRSRKYKKERLDRALEVMAGPGRNVELLKRFFVYVELLDASQLCLDECLHDVVKHHTLI